MLLSAFLGNWEGTMGRAFIATGVLILGMSSAVRAEKILPPPDSGATDLAEDGLADDGLGEPNTAPSDFPIFPINGTALQCAEVSRDCFAYCDAGYADDPIGHGDCSQSCMASLIACVGFPDFSTPTSLGECAVTLDACQFYCEIGYPDDPTGWSDCERACAHSYYECAVRIGVLKPVQAEELLRDSDLAEDGLAEDGLPEDGLDDSSIMEGSTDHDSLFMEVSTDYGEWPTE